MRWLRRLFPFGMALVACMCALLWWNTGSAAVSWRLPGADRPPGMPPAPAVDLAGLVVVGPGRMPPLRPEPYASWPGFRGLDNGRSAETGLLKDPARATILWQVAMGEGYAAPALNGGRVYILDYAGGCDALRCLSSEDGQELWRHTYKVDIKRNHGMSRTIPAVDDSVAIALGPMCHVVAVDARDGRFLWGKDLVKDYGSKVPPWYAGQCPLLREGRAYLAPAGDKVLLTALDAKTGSVLWEVPNPRHWKMTHSSIVEVMLEGRKTLVYCGSGGVIGVEESSGQVLWETTEWKVSIATVPSPVDLGDGRILFTGGYGAGAMIGRVEKAGDGHTLNIEKRFGPGTLGSEQQTPIVLPGGKALLAVIPDGQMICMALDGTIRWRSGATRFGSGAYLVAGATAYVINDTGVLSAVDATEGSYRLLGSRKVMMDGQECWGPMALADGRLYLRDMTRLFCLDMRAK